MKSEITFVKLENYFAVTLGNSYKILFVLQIIKFFITGVQKHVVPRELFYKSEYMK